jgi:hypothetical protein
MQKYRDVTLSIDVMKVNGIPFLNTISKHINIKFGSAGKLGDMKNTTFIRHLWVIFGCILFVGFVSPSYSLTINSNHFGATLPI